MKKVNEAAVKGIEKLCSFYGKTMTGVAIEVWEDRINGSMAHDIDKAINAVFDNERQMPTPGIFLNYLSQAKGSRQSLEEQKRRDEERKKTDEEFKKEPNDFFSKNKIWAARIDLMCRYSPPASYEKEHEWALAKMKEFPEERLFFTGVAREAQEKLAQWKAENQKQVITSFKKPVIDKAEEKIGEIEDGF